MPDRLKNFQEILNDAIDDVLAHGYDSPSRIAEWSRKLREAAASSMMAPTTLEHDMREWLTSTYRREVDRGGLVKQHPGIGRFTLEQVKPELRSELDRRITASANLIKLNRSEAIDKTLRRFEGWATSIPKGGTSAETRTEIKTAVRKSVGALPFEERRVLIDQGHKLTAAINEIVAKDGGAIAGVWRHRGPSPSYEARPEHVARDGKIFLLRDSWAHRQGLVRKGPAGYYDEVESVGQLPYCSCWIIWLHGLGELPPEMLTAKGRAALASAQGREEVRSARTARADSDESSNQAPKNIVLTGQSRRAAIPVPVDRDHDVAWMFVVSKNCDRLYADRTVPRQLTIKGTTFDPAELGWAHERGEWLFMMQLVADFIEKHGRHPNEAERMAIYRVAHREGGIPAEREAAKRLKVDWGAWTNWVAGKLSHLEKKRIRNPPPDPHVKPAACDRREPMENVAA